MKNYKIKAIDINTKEVVTSHYINLEKSYIKKEIVLMNDAGFNIKCAEIENLLKVGVINKLLVLRELEFIKNNNFSGKFEAFIVCYTIYEWLEKNVSVKEALAEAISNVLTLEDSVGYWNSNSWDDLNLATRYLENIAENCISNSYRAIAKIISQKGKLRKFMLPNSHNLAQIWDSIKPNKKIFCSEWSEMRLVPYLGDKEIGEQDTDFCFSDFRKELDYNEEYIEL